MKSRKKETQSQKDPSWNFYYCSYILRTEEVCNRKCYDLKEYKVHQNSRQVSYKKYDKLIRFRYDYCDTHTKKYKLRKYYHQKKQVKLASMQILIGNLEIN